MADLRAFEQLDSGGVDSRSNPINMPRNRALRCLNWVPKAAGFWEQRWGYSTITMTAPTNAAIHSMIPYRLWSGTKYLLYFQGTGVKALNLGTGVATTPTDLGTAVSSSARMQSYAAFNRIHYGNGTDQKFFDGTNIRDSGLDSFTESDINLTYMLEGVRELTAAQNSSVTLTPGATGTFPGDTTGRLIYVALFDTSVDELGPSTVNAGSGRVKIPINDKLTVGSLPNLSGVDTNWVKLIAGTLDGGNLAWFFTNTSTNLSAGATNGPLSLITFTAAGHGLSSGDIISITGTVTNNPNVPTFDGIYYVTVLDVDTFEVSYHQSSGGTSGATGVVKRIVSAANAATSVDVTADTRTDVIQANADRGLPASTIGTSSAGYQFYVSKYNPTTGHVGNRIAIAGRALQTAYRSNWRMYNIPQDGDTEIQTLFGRTIDGGQVPYVVADNSGNWLYGRNSIAGHFLISDAALDGNHEMPTRNGVIPAACNLFAQCGDFIYAGDTGSPYLRRSGDLSQADERGATFTGRPEQSWAADDVTAFPTAEALTGIFEVDQEVLCGTLNDTAISVNLAGIEQWLGPWPIGIAGARSGTKCGSHGFYFVTGDKQLATLIQGVPTVVSEEYQAAELFKIGDAYLSTTECAYFRDAKTDKDELRISCRDSNGNPFTVIHDFKNMDSRSLFGQGYEAQFVGPLATAYTMAQVRDGNGKLRVYGGASNGYIFDLYSGANDGGTEFDSDLILLVNAGTQRPSVPTLDWYGDQNIVISAAKELKASLDAGAEFTFDDVTPSDMPAEEVPGSENMFLWRAQFTTPEVQHAYLRFQLTSHSADGDLTLNDPPHIPLEDYGRLYELIPAVGDERPR